MTHGEITTTVNSVADPPAVEVSSSNGRSSSSLAQSLQGYLPLRFNKRRIHGQQTVRTLLPRHILDEENQESVETEEKIEQIRRLQKHYADNSIRTTKYTVLSFLPKNLFEQFHRFANCYFVFIILLNFIPRVGAIQPELSLVPVVGILLVQAIKDLFEDYGRYKSDRAVNTAKAEVNLSSDNKYHQVYWSDLKVGDIVRVVCNDVIPADLLLLHTSDVDGRCFIETSNIDGESNLKQRTVVKRHWAHDNPTEFHPRDFKSIIECQNPNNEIYKFYGNIIPPDNSDKIPINNNNLLLRGCVIRNTDYVEGIVIYAGHETKAMLNNNGPRHKRSKLERKMNTHVLYCVVLLVLMCLVGAVGNGVWAAQQIRIPQTELYLPRENDGSALDPALSGFIMFWTMVILLQVLIPISLYVSIELVKSAQVYMINNDRDLYHEESDTPMRCRALNITEDLGQIQYIFSDKTGTLTENQMVFRRCTVGGTDYPHAANAARIENLEPTPADINPVTAKHAEAFPRDVSSRQSYRRPLSGSIRPHHRRKISSAREPRNRAPPIDGDRVEEVDGFSRQTKSAPNSPGHTRKMKPSTRRPAAHHRRNISSVSAKEVLATVANQPDVDPEPEVQFDPEPIDDLETDVTPDPVLFRILQSVQSPTRHDVKMSTQKGRVLDFFINMAICNTVVISTDSSDAAENKDKTTKVLATPTGDRYTPVSSVDTTPDSRRAQRETPLQRSVHFEASSVDGSSTNSSTQQLIEPETRKFTSEELSRIRYEAESPDEAALVYAAHAYGCILANRSSTGGRETVTITLPDEEGSMMFEVLHKLPFDSARKRMSVVVRNPRTDQVTLYCKGADSAILPQLADPPSYFDAADGDYNDISSKASNSVEVKYETKKFLDAYARTGLRTLCISKKDLREEEYQEWLREYQVADRSIENREQLLMNCFYKIETDLELLGATGIEDRLQDGVPETIESLRQAGIKVWVLTGDKQETAINIGYSCRLIHQKDEVIQLNAESKDAFKLLLDSHNEDQDNKRGRHPAYEKQNSNGILSSFNISFVLPNSTTYPNIDDKDMPALVLVIDGKTLAFALQKDMQEDFVKLARRCRSVLCCRATPLQKGEVVKLIRHELKVMTLAIGDGANDVSMIQVADVGVGLSGQEGMQAVMSSDYALAQFRFLRKLLLVHGHWNYARLASMVLYFFYKNAAFVFLIFWFQIFCGFSGANMIEQWYLLLFNLVFTSVPPLVNGVLDKDITSKTLLRKPDLYKQGINDELYLPRSFWINIFDAVYQSLVIFFFSYFAYYDSSVGLIEWGTVVTSASVFVILVHLGIETKTWTWIHWLCQIGSIVVFFAFSLIYNIICPACSPPSNPYYIMERLVQSPNFWFSMLLITAVALFPRYLIRIIQSQFFASESQKERIWEKNRKYKAPSHISSSLDSSASNSSTYRNPTFQPPQSLDLSKNTNREKLFQCVPTEGPTASFYDPKFSASTPDLTSTSPYYGFQNHNESNNALRQRPWPRSGVEERAPAQAFVNNAFSGSMDCDQDSDTGECRKETSRPPRLSMKYAYGDYDLSDNVEPPVESAFLSPKHDDEPPVPYDVVVTSAFREDTSASDSNDLSRDVPV